MGKDVRALLGRIAWLESQLVDQKRYVSLLEEKPEVRERVIAKLAETIASAEAVSSGWMAGALGMSREEWHRAGGQLIAALFYFAVEEGFLEWHARDMVAPTPPPDEEKS